jgi:hypothetical protein
MPHLVTPCHEPLPARRWPALGGATAGLMALILAGCAGGLTGSAAQVPCPAMIEAPVLYPGDTWTVRSEDGRRNRRTYGAERDGLLSLRYSNSDADYYFDHTHTLRKVWSKGQWVTAPTPTFWDIGKPTLVFPLTPGEGWVSTVPAGDDYGMTFLRRHTVVGCEQVTVPAGTFVAVRIDVSQVQSTRPANAAMEWTLWYAPAVKYFVKRASGPATFWTPVPGYELESYKIDAGKPATK